ncbi:MAG: ABC transporter ATP-binding protein [Pseudomonadota bacterium]
MTARPIIQIQNAVKRFGDFTALNNVSLDIQEGEFFSLLGPSGCGKTTLLRLIAGFGDATEGTILIGGEDMTGVPANHRPTNMVFQSYAVFPHLNVADNVAFGLRRRGLPRAERDQLVNEALDRVGLSGLGHRRANELSGGQRQRVALARALVLSPKVLLLDEPLSALDKKLREQMQVELRRLQRSVGITFILVTHDQEEALTMSDRIAVMFDGKISQIAGPEELYQKPATRRVAEFIGGMNFLDATVTDDANGEVTLDSKSIGTITLPRPEAFLANDQDVTLAVRPERLTVSENGQDLGGHVLDGKIADTAYYGETTHYSVDLDRCGTRIWVSVSNSHGSHLLATGQPVRVGWDPAALVLLN